MRRILATTITAFAVLLVQHAFVVASPSSPSRGLVSWQVNDILKAVKSAINGKPGRRSSRRYRGSNKPILSKAPVPPMRRPVVGSASDEAPRIESDLTLETKEKPSTKTVASAQIPPKITLRPAIVLVEPKRATSVAVPSKRPIKSTKATNTTPQESDDQDRVDEVAPPIATTWKTEEISAAYDKCETLLGRLTVSIEPVEPMRKGACGIAGPVKLSSLGETHSVIVKPAATLNCKTVARIHRWLEQKVQPAALNLLKSPVVRIRNVSSYACRNRNNSKKGKLSEHAIGNALDIASFVLRDGRTVSVLSDWGTVKRDQLALEQKPLDANKQRKIRVKIASRSTVVASASYISTVALPVFKGPVHRGIRLNRVPDPGGPTAEQDATWQPETKIAARPVQSDIESRFLKKIHADACGIFATVLGPEANDAHRDHFHLDTATRNYKAYCR